MSIVESKLNPQQASYDIVLPAGESWLHEVKRGQVFRRHAVLQRARSAGTL